MAAGRNAKGQFVKRGGRAPRKSKSKALARRAPSRIVVREVSRAPARRRSSGGGRGGMLGSAGKWFGDPGLENLAASAAIGWIVGHKRATVDEYLAKAPEFLQPIGGFGVMALTFGAIGEMVPGLRKYTKPLARQAAGLAAYHLGKRGSLYDAKADKLAGDEFDDDSAGDDDDIDTSGVAEYDDDSAGDDDDDSAGDDDDDSAGAVEEG